MRNGISNHPVNAGSGVQLLDAIYVAQFLGGHLSGSGGLRRSSRREGESAPRAYSQDAADDSLLSHAHANQGMAVTPTAEKLDHGDGVGKRCGRAEDLI